MTLFLLLRCKIRLEDYSDSDSWTVSDLSSDAFIALVLKFLTRLQDADGSKTFTLSSLDTTAPVGVASKHRVGSKLANILKVSEILCFYLRRLINVWNYYMQLFCYSEGTGLCWGLWIQSLFVSKREGNKKHFVMAGGKAAEVRDGRQ